MTMKILRSFKSCAPLASFAVAALLASFALTGSGCKFTKKYIDKAVFEISPDLNTAKVSLVFTQRVRANFSNEFAIKDYGTLYTLPFVQGSQPFQAGFNLNMSVLYDNEYVQMEPTSTLPNGMPLGTDVPLVQVNAGVAFSRNAQFLAYLDIRSLRWLGMATLIKAVDENFPTDLMVSQVFLRDQQGKPAVFGTFFGPRLNPDGTVAQPGGLSVFANVKALLGARSDTQLTIELKPEPGLILSGPAAEHYRAHPQELERVGDRFLEALGSL
jgi:hypothetical protein